MFGYLPINKITSNTETPLEIKLRINHGERWFAGAIIILACIEFCVPILDFDCPLAFGENVRCTWTINAAD